jgi:hypothetical protein
MESIDMKNALIMIVFSGFISGSVFAAGATGAGKGYGAAGKGSEGMGMGMGAGQSREQMLETQEQRFRAMDGDHDGYVTRQEAENHQRLRNNWEKADADADGKLNASEFSAFEEVIPPGKGR